MRRWTLCAATLVQLLTSSSVVSAWKQSDLAACNHSYRDPKAAIAGCSELVGRLDADNNAKILILRARAYMHINQLDEAIADDTAAIELRPQPAAYQDRASAYDAKEQYAEAIKDLDRAVSLQANSFSLFDRRCQTRAHGNLDLDKALADCNAAIRLAPGINTLYASRGFVYLRLGKLADALSDYNRAIEGPIQAALYNYGRGIVELRTGDKVAGERDLAAAQASDPNIQQKFATWGISP